MAKDLLTSRGAFALLVVIMVCNSTILGLTNDIGTDTWLATLVTAAVSVPLMLIYARLIHLMPGMSILEMSRSVFGAAGEKIYAALYSLYFILLTATVRNYYAEFVHITTLVHTPFIVTLFAFFVACTYLAKSGFSTKSRWYPLIFFLVTAVMIIVTLFSIPRMDFDNFLPFVENDAATIVAAGLNGVDLPMGEAVVFMAFAGNLERGTNPYKLLLGSLMVSVAFLLLVFFQYMSVLGEYVSTAVYYPSHTAASVLEIGSGIRIESLVSLAFMIAGISKVAACMNASGASVSSLLNIKDPGLILIPVSFFTVAISSISFESNIDLQEYIKVYPLFAVLFQVLMPLILWITAEVRRKMKGLKAPKAWNEPLSRPEDEKPTRRSEPQT